MDTARRQPDQRDGQWRARRFIAIAAVFEILLLLGWLLTDDGHAAPRWVMRAMEIAWPLSFLLFLTAVGAWVRRVASPIALLAFGLKAISAAIFAVTPLVIVTLARNDELDLLRTFSGVAVVVNSVGNMILFVVAARSGDGRPLTWGLAIVGVLWVGLQLGLRFAGEDPFGGEVGGIVVDLVWLLLMLSLWQMRQPAETALNAWPSVLKGADRFRSAVFWRVGLALAGFLVLLAATGTRSQGLALAAMGAMIVGEVIIATMASRGLWAYAAVGDDTGADLLARSAWAGSVLLVLTTLASAALLAWLALDGDRRTFAETIQRLGPQQATTAFFLALVTVGGFLLSVARLGRWLGDGALRGGALHTTIAMVVALGASLLQTLATGANGGAALAIKLGLLFSAIWFVIMLLKTTTLLMRVAENQALTGPFGGESET